MALFGVPIRLRSAAAILTVVAAACTTSPAPAAPAAAQPLGTVVLRLAGDWGTFDPFPAVPVGAGVETQIAYGGFYDSLLYWARDPKAPDKRVLVPYLAESWKSTPTTWSFTLKKDVTCADGTPMNATAVKTSYERSFKAPGALGKYGGKAPVTVANDAARTLEITLPQPYSDAQYLLPLTKIVCPAGNAAPATLLTAPNGSGPFVLESAVHGESIVVKRREDWTWGPDGMTAKELPEKVVYKIVASDTTAANLLLTGGLDVALIGGPDVPRLEADKSLTLKTATSFWNYVQQFNHSPNRATGNVKVREALTTAVDPKGYAQAAFEGRANTSPSFLMPGADCFEPSVASFLPKTYGPAAAQKLLLDAGWTLNPSGKLVKDGELLTILLVGPNTLLGSGPEYVASQFDKAGITVNARIVDRGLAGTAYATLNFDVYLGINPADLPDPAAVIQVFSGEHAPKGTNRALVTNPEMEREIAAARRSPNNGPERCQHWSNVQKAVISNFHVAPLASPQSTWFSKGIDFDQGPRQTDPRYFRRLAK